MKIFVRLSLVAALAIAPASFAFAQSLPGAGLLGKAQAAQSAATIVGGNSALSGAARDMAVNEATGTIKKKAGDYAKQKALETAVQNPALAGKALGVAGKVGAVGR